MANCYYPNPCLCNVCFERLMGDPYDTDPSVREYRRSGNEAALYKECTRSWGGCSCAGCTRDKWRGTYD